MKHVAFLRLPISRSDKQEDLLLECPVPNRRGREAKVDKAGLQRLHVELWREHQDELDVGTADLVRNFLHDDIPEDKPLFCFSAEREVYFPHLLYERLSSVDNHQPGTDHAEGRGIDGVDTARLLTNRLRRHLHDEVRPLTFKTGNMHAAGGVQPRRADLGEVRIGSKHQEPLDASERLHWKCQWPVDDCSKLCFQELRTETMHLDAEDSGAIMETAISVCQEIECPRCCTTNRNAERELYHFD